MPEKTYKELIQSNQTLFWDVNTAALDPEKNKYYIIPRVMDYGTLEDVQATMRYYGNETILEVLKNCPYLDKKTISYFAFYFKIPREEFRSYRKRQTFHTWR